MDFITKFLRSFLYAFNGCLLVLKERSFKIHLFVALIVIVSAFIFNLSLIELIIIILLIFMVFSIETMNTSIEKLSDIIRDECHLSYQATKAPRDLAAASVFMVVISAVIIGLLILLPKIIQILFRQ
ncbi:MAG: hypothetical protein KatS3mg084_0128 [Candidatus Dojkabacteria bacterium]|nr:MAG: hypothetical protein KatS3mg084_0128 [Candidatus Dojkabacteria bacterium]